MVRAPLFGAAPQSLPTLHRESFGRGNRQKDLATSDPQASPGMDNSKDSQ